MPRTINDKIVKVGSTTNKNIMMPKDTKDCDIISIKGTITVFTVLCTSDKIILDSFEVFLAKNQS